MDRRPAIKPGPDLRQDDSGRDDDSFDSATDGDGYGRLDTGVTGLTGSSIDTIYDLGLPAEALADDVEDAELDEPVPNAERLVAQAVALAGDDHDAATLVGRFWRFAPDEELVGFTAEEMLDAARAHRDLAQQRRAGRAEAAHPRAARRRSTTPSSRSSPTTCRSWSTRSPRCSTRTTSTCTCWCTRWWWSAASRWARLTEVSADVEPDDAIAGDLVESWMRIEIDPVRDAAERDRLRRELQRVLTDVREAVEDWPKMRQRALALADELAAADVGHRPPVPEKDITDSVELLRWLAHDHFTFLGYREYRLVDASWRTATGAGGGARHRAGHPAPDSAGRPARCRR